ncbi:MAG: hypothetical protein AABY22_31150, partial [Nanoarchaeota archaeon]
MKKIKWQEHEIQFLRDHYPENGVNFCVGKLNRSRPSILNKCFELKIQWIVKNKSFIDLNKFDTPKFAYLLGFLWADGHVQKKRPIVMLSIQEKDEKEIKELLEYSGEWKYHYNNKKNGKRYFSAAVYDVFFYKKLKELGFIEKSNSNFSKVLEVLSQENRKYFIRGYFDGDGYVAENKYKIVIAAPYNCDWSSLRSETSDKNIEWIIEFQQDDIGRASCAVISNERCYLNFFKYIYGGEFFGLSRKRDRFIFFIIKSLNRLNSFKNFVKKGDKYISRIKLNGKTHNKSFNSLEECMDYTEEKQKDLQTQSF